ncbi:MAG: hypothetical protein ACE10B_05665 [Phycisphaerales bacterium]
MVGPILALAFGWGPAWLWIILGAIFDGGAIVMRSRMWMHIDEQAVCPYHLSSNQSAESRPGASHAQRDHSAAEAGHPGRVAGRRARPGPGQPLADHH